MNTSSSISTSGLSASAHGPLTGSIADAGQRLATTQNQFAGVLNRAREITPESDEAAARDAAEQLVAITLVQPVLAQLRETNTAAPPFGPTAAEKQFGSMMDARVAQDIVHGSRFPLVDQLANSMLERLGKGA